jgi:hypothetical protein
MPEEVKARIIIFLQEKESHGIKEMLQAWIRAFGDLLKI